MEVIIAYIVLTQIIMLPILGAIFLGIREQRRRREEMFRRALATVKVLGGRHVRR